MIQLALGFPGERFVYLPLSLLGLMQHNPYTNDLYIYSLGYFSHALYHYINRPEGCSQYLFIYCQEGEGWIILNEKKHNLRAHEFIILPPDIPHSYGASENSPWSIYWIHFLGSKANVFSENFNKPIPVLPSEVSRIDNRLKLFDEMYTVLKSGFTLENLNYANVCLAHFLGTFVFINSYRNSAKSSEYAESIINRATYFMNENICNKLTIPEISGYLGYSPSYFYRKFIKETGYSPMDYFIRLKLNRACAELIQTDMKVNQIAHKLGFNDAYYFSRIFTILIGVSPLKFRKQNLKTDSITHL